MVAPMTWWGEVRGVIGVGTTDPERRFSPEDVEVLEAFASLGSVALRNVASIEQSTRQAAHPARLLPNRLGAGPAALAGRDSGRRRPGGE